MNIYTGNLQAITCLLFLSTVSRPGPFQKKLLKRDRQRERKKTIDEMPRNLIVTMVKLYNYPLFCFAFILEWSLARAFCQVNGVEQLERYY